MGMDDVILSYLKMGYSFDEIRSEFDLNKDDFTKFLNNLNNRIKEGYLNKRFYSNGTIEYEDEKKELAIITLPDEKSFHFLVISDTHIGSIHDNMSYLDMVYDYCIKNGINYIFHAGDLIDGTTGHKDERSSLYDQILKVIDKYPYDDSITNLITLGNHDFDSIKSFPVEKYLVDERPDLIPIGYGTNEVFLKNESFIISHFNPFEKEEFDFSHKLIFKGHSHRMKLKDDNTNHTIYVPTLSDLILSYNDTCLPGFLDVTINFYNGHFKNAIIKNMGIIARSIHQLSVDDLYQGYRIKKIDQQLNVKEYIKR